LVLRGERRVEVASGKLINTNNFNCVYANNVFRITILRKANTWHQESVSISIKGIKNKIRKIKLF
jgi:hypothetical protein